MKNAVFNLFIILFSNLFVNAQTKDDFNKIVNGQWMYELNPSSFVMLYKLNFFTDKNNNKISITELLANENIELDTLKYGKIKYNHQFYLATKKSQNSDVRLFKIFKESMDYFVLCDENDDLCDCKSGTFLYYKPKLKLQRVEKPFSFSLKRNLISRLGEFNIALPSGYESMNFCGLLEKL